MNFLGLLAQHVKPQDPREKMFVTEFTSLLGEAALESFLKDVDFKKNPDLNRFYIRFIELFKAYGMQPEDWPWLQPVISKLQPPEQ